MAGQWIDDRHFRQRYGFSRDDDVLRVEIWAEPGGGVLAEHRRSRTPKHPDRRRDAATRRNTLDAVVTSYNA